MRLHCSSSTRTNQLWSGCNKTQVCDGWEGSLAASPRSSWRRGCPEPPSVPYLPAARAGAVCMVTALEITTSLVIYTADHFRAKLAAEIYFRLKTCKKQDLHGTNYRQEMWGGGLLLWFYFVFYYSHHINKLQAQKISDLDQPHAQ